MGLFDNLLENSAKVADKVAKVTGEYIDKGKGKLNELSLENELSKAHKQLGALVYALHKSGENNDELVNQYFEEIANIEKQLEEAKAQKEEKEEKEVIDVEPSDIKNIKYCHNCGKDVDSDDAFCKYCGTAVK
ncbi:MAG: zinc-ribbon domain-containing protein [Ruminococcaceae bacterium]|nr:zinc-ribbon domain-containing protein [Oscillospiraceae bacterium]